MSDLPLISVIVPIYNSEKYLNRCLDSICRQTYQNLEVIMVNDGSSDRSEEICQEYEQKDGRFRLASQKNQGSAAARNTGLQLAKGELIGFVDSDDQICPMMYTHLFRIMTENNADIAFCDVERNGEPEHPEWIDGTYSGKASIFSEFIHGRVINRVYNKLYKAGIVCGIVFPVGRNMMEDASWTPRVLERANCITRLAKPLYLYTDNEAGITRSKTSQIKVCSRFANLLDRESICLRNAENETDRNIVADELIRYIRQMMETSENLEMFNVFQTLKEIVEKHWQILEQTAMNKDEKIMLSAILEGDLTYARKQYRKAVWLFGGSIREKLRLIRSLIG